MFQKFQKIRETLDNYRYSREFQRFQKKFQKFQEISEILQSSRNSRKNQEILENSRNLLWPLFSTYLQLPYPSKFGPFFSNSDPIELISTSLEPIFNQVQTKFVHMIYEYPQKWLDGSLEAVIWYLMNLWQTWSSRP